MYGYLFHAVAQKTTLNYNYKPNNELYYCVFENYHNLKSLLVFCKNMIQTEWYHTGFGVHFDFRDSLLQRNEESNVNENHSDNRVAASNSIEPNQVWLKPIASLAHVCDRPIVRADCPNDAQHIKLPGQGHIKDAFVGWCCLFVLSDAGQLFQIKFDSAADRGRTHQVKWIQLQDSFVTRDLDWGPGQLYMLTRQGQVCYWDDSDLSTKLKVESRLGPKSPGENPSVKAISVGASFACSLMTNGLVKGIDEEQSEVEFGSPSTDPFEAIACGQRHLLLLSKSGKVYSFGEGSKGQLGHGDLTDRWTDCGLVQPLEGVAMLQVSAGSAHSLALSEFGDVYAWGTNESGQIGTDHTNSTASIVTVPTLIQAPEDVHFVSIACGSRHSIAITQHGQLWTWGWNKYGQCALPLATVNIYRPTQVQLPPESKAIAIKGKYWSSIVLLAFK